MSAFLLSCPCGGDGGHTLAHSWSCKYSIEHHPGHGRAKGSLGPLAASRGELGWSSLSVCLSVCLLRSVGCQPVSQSVSQHRLEASFKSSRVKSTNGGKRSYPKLCRSCAAPSFLPSLLPCFLLSQIDSTCKRMHCHALSQMAKHDLFFFFFFAKRAARAPFSSFFLPCSRPFLIPFSSLPSTLSLAVSPPWFPFSAFS